MIILYSIALYWQPYCFGASFIESTTTLSDINSVSDFAMGMKFVAIFISRHLLTGFSMCLDVCFTIKSI